MVEMDQMMSVVTPNPCSEYELDKLVGRFDTC